MADASQTVPGDFNALYDDTTRVARGGAPPTLRAAQPAIARMTNEVPNISVHLDEATQNPVQVTVAQGPEVRGATGLTTRAAASPEAAARQFVKDRADLVATQQPRHSNGRCRVCQFNWACRPFV